MGYTLLRREDRSLHVGGDPDVIEKRSGGGCLTLFGIPFFLAGLWVLLTGLGAAAGGGAAAFLAAAVPFLVGLVFMVVGALLIFGRSGLIIDRRLNRVVRWQGLLVPQRRSVAPLDGFDGVRLDCEREDKRTSYPVRLTKGGDTAGAVTVEAPADYGRARQIAETLARFVRKPLDDRSSGQSVIRDPDHLDESLRERVRRLREERGFLPPPPIPMRTKIEQTVDGVVLSIPGRAGGSGRILRAVLPLLSIGAVAYMALPGFRPLLASLLPQLLIGLAVLAVAIRIFSGRSGTATRVTVTRALLRLEEGTAGKGKTTEIPAEELEELVYADRRSALAGLELPGMKRLKDFGDTGTPRLADGRPVPKFLIALSRLVPSQGISGRSDRTVVNFGKGLADEELAYLHALIRKTLTE